jgi:hypothetical protein
LKASRKPIKLLILAGRGDRPTFTIGRRRDQPT